MAFVSSRVASYVSRSTLSLSFETLTRSAYMRPYNFIIVYSVQVPASSSSKRSCCFFSLNQKGLSVTNAGRTELLQLKSVCLFVLLYKVLSFLLQSTPVAV